ncbi:hypothetical protein I4U23_003498 [Adineta vaga]|nr:hypothetical protein I4U23_003498 [Adineta vaga]
MIYFQKKNSSTYIIHTMRSSYGGPGSSRSTWKPAQDPGKQAPAASNAHQASGKNNTNRPTGNTSNIQSHEQQLNNEEKKE